MLIHAQFYQLSTGYIPGSIPPQYDDSHKKPIEACGDRAVIILDGRNNSQTWHAIARAECKKRGYIGYVLRRGERFTQARDISTPIML